MDFFDSAFDSIHGRTVDLKEDSSFFETCFNDMCSDDYMEESISSVFSNAKKAFLKIFNNVWKKIGSSASKLKKHLTGAPLFKTESCDDLFESAGNDIVDAKLEDKPMIGFRILKIDFNAYFAWWAKTFSVIKDSLKRASAHPDDVETQAKDYIKIMDTWVLTDKEMRNEYTKIVQKFKLQGSGESYKIVADAYKECFSEDAFNALANNPKKSKKFIDTVIDTMNNDVIKRYNEYNSEFDSSSEIRKMYLDLWNDGKPKCNIMLLKGVDAQLSEISSSMDGMRKNSFAFIKDFTNRLISASKSNDHVSSESVESFEEDDLNLAEEFFPEAAVDSILAPLSKFRASINTWSKNCNIKYAQKIANDSGKKIRVYKDPKKTEDVFNEYIKTVESTILPKLDSHSSFKEIKDICKSANSKYFKHLGESRLEGGKEYAQSALRNECKRCSESIISSAKKISRAIDDVGDAKDPNFARACSYVITMTSKVCTSALNEINSLAEKYDAKIAKRTGLAEGFSAGYDTGYSSGYSSGHAAGSVYVNM